MNTPSHIVLGLVALGRRERPRLLAPLALGGLLPDAPMFWFYLVERVWNGQPERWLWSEGYFLPGWQDFFDVFNSLPLIAIGLAVAWKRGSQWWMALLFAMGLHAGVDMLVHHDDGHRHFFPFLDFRFESPISYWDPKHYGLQFAAAEATVAIAACIHLWRTHSLRWVRVLAATLGTLTGAGVVFGLLYWMGSR